MYWSEESHFKKEYAYWIRRFDLMTENEKEEWRKYISEQSHRSSAYGVRYGRMMRAALNKKPYVPHDP